MFENKQIKVVLIGGAKKTYQELKKSRINSEENKVYVSTIQAISRLKKNPHEGIHIPKRLIPKIYKKEYGIKSLWKYNLLFSWRMLYINKSDGDYLYCIIIGLVDHKQYDRLFRYK